MNTELTTKNKSKREWNTKGGARKGAGRKPRGFEPVYIKYAVSAENKAAIKARAKSLGLTIKDYIDLLIEKDLDRE